MVTTYEPRELQVIFSGGDIEVVSIHVTRLVDGRNAGQIVRYWYAPSAQVKPEDEIPTTVITSDKLRLKAIILDLLQRARLEKGE